jgi:hypothetical protein
MLHMLQELAFAGAAEAEIEVQVSLLHGLDILGKALRRAHNRVSYAKFP